MCDGQTIQNVSNDLTSSNTTTGTSVQATSSYMCTKLSPPPILRRGSRHKRRRSKMSDELNSSSDYILPDEHPVSRHMVSGCRKNKQNWTNLHLCNNFKEGSFSHFVSKWVGHLYVLRNWQMFRLCDSWQNSVTHVRIRILVFTATVFDPVE